MPIGVDYCSCKPPLICCCVSQLHNKKVVTSGGSCSTTSVTIDSYRCGIYLIAITDFNRQCVRRCMTHSQVREPPSTFPDYQSKRARWDHRPRPSTSKSRPVRPLQSVVPTATSVPFIPSFSATEYVNVFEANSGAVGGSTNISHIDSYRCGIYLIAITDFNRQCVRGV